MLEIDKIFTYSDHYWAFICCMEADEDGEYYVKELRKYDKVFTDFKHSELELLFCSLGLDKSARCGFKFIRQNRPEIYPEYKIFDNLRSCQDFVNSIFAEYEKQGGSYIEVIPSENPSLFISVSYRDVLVINYLVTPKNIDLIKSF